MYETSLRARIIPKVFIFLKVISFIFCLGHLIFSVIFFGQRAFIFCVYSVLSTIFYAILCYSIRCLTSRNIKSVADILTYIIIELSIFVTVSLLLVGSPSGFQHYIYGIFVFIMFENYISSNTTKSVLLTLFSCLCTFIPSLLLYYIDSYYNFNNGLASAFDIVNTLVVIALFISYIFIFGNIITNFEDDIIYQAYHDKLTGLHNRTLLSQLTFDSDHTYVAILDIDDFKKVNDTYGHLEGDALLIAVADTLRTSVRSYDIVGRIGGDEFVVYLSNVTDRQNAMAVAEKLCQVIRGLSTTKKEWSNISASIGISFADHPDIKMEELYISADKAMYSAKGNGRDQYQTL